MKKIALFIHDTAMGEGCKADLAFYGAVLGALFVFVMHGFK
jgi:hypothetical protein